MGKKKIEKKKEEDTTEDVSNEEEVEQKKSKAIKTSKKKGKEKEKEKEDGEGTPVVESITNKDLVDKYFENRSKYTVIADNNNLFNGKYYSCILYNTDKNCSKFYLIQLLKQDSNKKSSLYTRWGRIGKPGKHKLEPTDAASGPETFMRRFSEKLKHGYHEIREDNSDD